MKTKTDMSREAVTHRLKQMEGLWMLSKALGDAKVVRKNGRKKNRGLEILESIRQVLLQDWDPIGISCDPNVTDEYDVYIAPIYRILVGTRSKDELIECLRRIERDEIAVGTGKPGSLLPTAEKLLELKVTID
jgi:hypothetical protein